MVGNCWYFRLLSGCPFFACYHSAWISNDAAYAMFIFAMDFKTFYKIDGLFFLVPRHIVFLFPPLSSLKIIMKISCA